MFAHLGLRASAMRGRRILHGLTRLLPAPLCLLLLAGCAGAPPAPVSGAHPANPECWCAARRLSVSGRSICDSASERSGRLERKQ